MTRNSIFGYFRHIFKLTFAKNVKLFIKIQSLKQIKSVNLESKMSHASNFGLLLWKAILILDVSIPEFGKCNVREKIEILKFCTKKLKFEIWKAIVIFEIRTLEFLKMKSFLQNKENFKFGAKNVLFGYFWDAILKSVSTEATWWHHKQ